MQVYKLLVVDDDQTLRYSIRSSLESSLLRVLEAASPQQAIVQLNQNPPDVVLLDLRLNEANGIDLLKEIKASHIDIPVIVFTAYSTTTSTIEASKHGAFEYLLKPVDLRHLLATIDRALRTRGGSLERLKSDESQESEPSHAKRRPRALEFERNSVEARTLMIGSSAAMQDVYKKIGRFAPTNGNILILGESGTGKELVARAVHEHSRRNRSQFLAINCAALSETILESELFGHEKNAFTGALKRRIGKFEYADGGTIFLDEVADMSPATQAKVLRLLQDQRFERLGGNETIETDVRIVAATNKDLIGMVRQGLFRVDLFYRLNVFTISLPPLRERKEDLHDLVTFFTEQFKSEFAKETVDIDTRVFERIGAYDWPGNLRELQSSVRYALAHTDGSVMRPEFLPSHIVNDLNVTPSDVSQESFLRQTELLLRSDHSNIYQELVFNLESVLLPTVLSYVEGNLQQACWRLGLSRNTLKAKMRDHGISVSHRVLSKTDISHQTLKDPSQAGHSFFQEIP